MQFVSKKDTEKTAATDDASLFREAIRGARPLRKQDVRVPEPPGLRAKARFSRADDKAVLAESLSSPSDHIEGDSGEHLSFRRDGIGPRILRKLRRGRYSIADEIDLHGLTVAEARNALRGFIEQALANGYNCVRIVHGKGRGSGHGGPILKRKVDVWLRQWEPVLAFVSAQPADGGTGAVYVLLKRG